MNKHLRNLTYTAVLWAAAFLLPFLTANDQALGNAVCPMHVPVLLCGIICGPVWGGVMGFCAPLLRSAVIGAPPFPLVALPMAFELLAYAVTAGVLYRLLKNRLDYYGIYVALLVAMVVGRVVLGVAKYFVMGFKELPFGIEGFITGSVLPAWPGVCLQFALIPPIIYALKKAKLF